MICTTMESVCSCVVKFAVRYLLDKCHPAGPALFMIPWEMSRNESPRLALRQDESGAPDGEPVNVDLDAEQARKKT